MLGGLPAGQQGDYVKKKTCIFFCFILLLSVSCTKQGIISKKTHEAVSTSNEHKDYQSNDKMMSNYRESKGDGYSWRYREITYNKNDKIVTKNKMLSTVWKMDSKVNQYAVLVFYSDDVFKIGTFQAGVSIQGNYRIENSNIYLSNYNADEFMNQFIKFNNKETEGVVIFNSDNVEYDHELFIGGTKFFPLGSEKVNGDKAIIQDSNVIVDKSTYVFNDTVRFRTKPSVDSDCIDISLYNEMSGGRIKTNSFKKGTIVNTIAKTVNTEKIDGKIASWYYLVVSDGFEGRQYGWVFGAYFDQYIKENDSIYWEILRTEIGLTNDDANDGMGETISADQLNQLSKNKEIAEYLYMLKDKIELNADKTTERKDYYTIYYNNGNSAYSTVVQFVNNDYLIDSKLKIGNNINDIVKLLGVPTKSSEKEMVYDIFKPNEGYGYRLTFEINEQKIQKIECYFEK
jgi:hypothetical protein